MPRLTEPRYLLSNLPDLANGLGRTMMRDADDEDYAAAA
jgi:hypothetical protein